MPSRDGRHGVGVQTFDAYFQVHQFLTKHQEQGLRPVERRSGKVFRLDVSVLFDVVMILFISAFCAGLSEWLLMNSPNAFIVA